MDYKNPHRSTWVFARLVLALAIAGVLGYRWHQGWLTWPLILMSAFISGLLLLEIFTARRTTVNAVPPAARAEAEDDRLTS